MRWGEFLSRKFRGWSDSVSIAAPENRSQATAIGPADIANQVVSLLIADLCSDSIHAGLARERLAKRSRAQLPLFKGKHGGEPARVKKIECGLQRCQVLDD